MTLSMREAAATSRQTRRAVTFAASLVVFVAALASSGALGASAPQAHLSAVGITRTGFTVKWRGLLGANGYAVYRNKKLLLRTPHTSVTFTNLRCGHRYSVSIRPFDWARKMHFASATRKISTATCRDTVRPTMPVGFKISKRTPTSLALTWRPSKDNVKVVSYRIVIASIRATARLALPAARIIGVHKTSYVVGKLSCATAYNLSVESLDAAGNGSAPAKRTASTSACASPKDPAGAPADPTTPTTPTTPTDPGAGGGGGATPAPPPPPDTAAPSVPAGLHTTAVAATSVSLAWTASTDNVGVSGYTAYSTATSVGTSSSTSYTVSGLTCGTSYTFTVDAYDAAGNHSVASGSLNVSTGACVGDTAAPSVPTGLHTTAITLTTVALAWTASTDNVAVTGYTRYADGASQGTAAGTTGTVTGLTCGTSYAFTVDAFDAAGNHSPRSAVVNATTNACPDISAPSVPTALHSTTTTGTSIALAWTASTDSVGVVGYTIYRGGVSVGTGAATIATVTGLTCGTSYAFTVDAYDAAGNHSSASAALNASTSPCPDTTAPSVPAGLHTTALTTTSVTIAWNTSADNVGVTGYTTYRGGASAGTSAGTSFTITGLACGTSYAFSVDAYDAAGNHSAKSATLSASTGACGDTTAPSVPTGLSSTGVTSTSATLAWNASTDNVAVTGYTTYSNGASAGTGAGTSYTVTGLACNTSYTFSVDAYDAAGNHSAHSATFNASTSACAGPPPSGTTANVWVDPSGGSCARSAAPVGWSDATACGSFNAAYQACRPGDVILVQNGAYGNQSFTTNGSAGSPGCTLKPAGALGNVTVTSLNFSDTTWLTVQDLTSASSAHNSRANIDFDNAAKSPWDAHVSIVNGTYGGIFSRANYLLYKGLDLGDCDTGVCGAGEDGIKVSSAGCGPCSISTPGSHDVVFDGVYEHDVISNGVGHVDCMQAYGASRITVKNSMFYNCPEQAFIFTSLTGAWAPGCTSCEDGQVFENDYIAVFNGAGGAALAIGDNGTSDCHNCIVRNVTALTKNSGLDFDPATSIIENNIFQSINHTCNSAFSYNVYIGLGCGGTGAKTCTPTWTDSGHSHANADLATSDTCAKGAGNPGNYSPLDIYGTARASHLHNGAPDAGAYQLP